MRRAVAANAVSIIPKRQKALLALAFLLSAAGNKILLRLLLVRVAEYTHLLGVITNFIYIATFGFWLRVTATAGPAAAAGVAASARYVSNGQGLWYLAGAGSCEGLAFVLMPLFISRLPGSLIPVMSQGLLLFSMLFSTVLLGRRYNFLQAFGVFVVVVGVCTCTLPTLVAPGAVAWSPLAPAAGLFCTYGFIALSLCLKEVAFTRFRTRSGAMEGETLSIEVVNFAAALWQGLTLLLFWPLNFALVSPLCPAVYFSAGAAALLGTAPVLVPYLLVNLCYTVVTTVVLKRLSAVAILLTNVLNVPLVSLVFCLNLPLLGAEPFRRSFVAGLAVIIVGLLTYNYRSVRRASAVSDGRAN